GLLIRPIGIRNPSYRGLNEAREVMNMTCRIAAIRLLEPALDANYQAVKQQTYAWPINSSNRD
ncbi:MAG: hypothetical protein WCS37_13350, partial [Chloroflexota bacterium]